jgi:hypothetical protein
MCLQDEIRTLLTDHNKFDLELYEYAQSLMALRIKFIGPMITVAHEEAHIVPLSTSTMDPYLTVHSRQCPSFPEATHRNSMLLSAKYKSSVGFFQPPGHKGPF